MASLPATAPVVDQQPSGWSTDVYTASPGIPGDSGSGFMTVVNGTKPFQPSLTAAIAGIRSFI